MINQKQENIIYNQLLKFPEITNVLILEEEGGIKGLQNYNIDTNLKSQKLDYEAIIYLKNNIAFKEIQSLIKNLKYGGLMIVKEGTIKPNEYVSLGLTIINKIEGLYILGLFGKTDIIIPVYGAYDYLKECVKSIREFTDNVPYRLVIIDDKGPDDKILAYLKKIVNREDVLIENKTNLGFVKSVNKGLKVSGKTHKVLLNTDTIVTKNWLSNMLTAIFTDSRVKIVNPLSNSSSIYSITNLPYKIEKYQDAIKTGEIIANNENPISVEIPTAVGFCMLIDRGMTQKVGYLDEIFGVGYGEENDFCMRVKELGYKIVLQTNCFVYHKGGISMILSNYIKPGESTNQENEEILVERYPHYPLLIQDFLRSSAMSKIKSNIQNTYLRILRKNKRTKLLFQSHNRIDSFLIGGTEYHIKNLVDILKYSYDCFVASYEEGNWRIVQFYDDFQIEYMFPLSNYVLPHTIYNNDIKKDLIDILSLLAIDVVHIHHNLNFCGEVVIACEELSIPCIFTSHDYYSLSPDYNLMLKYDEAIEMVNNKKNIPDEQIVSEYEIADFSGERWLSMNENFLNRMDLIISPSNFTKEKMRKAFPDINQEKFISIEHGVDRPVLKKPENNKKISICILGVCSMKSKGRDFVEKLSRNSKTVLKDIKFTLLGTPDSANLKLEKNFENRGLYKREELFDILEEINPDFILLPSVWDETYCYTLTEAWIMQAVPIVFDRGAQADRIKNNGAGIVLKDTKITSFLEVINKFHPGSKNYKDIQKKIKKLEIPSISTMVNEYKTIYENLADRKKERGKKIFPNAYTKEMAIYFTNLEKTKAMIIDSQVPNHELAKYSERFGFKLFVKLYDIIDKLGITALLRFFNTLIKKIRP